MSENLRAQLTAAIEDARDLAIRAEGARAERIDRLGYLRAISAAWDEDALHARTHAMHPDACFEHTAEIEADARRLLREEAG